MKGQRRHDRSHPTPREPEVSKLRLVHEKRLSGTQVRIACGTEFATLELVRRGWLIVTRHCRVPGDLAVGHGVLRQEMGTCADRTPDEKEGASTLSGRCRKGKLSQHWVHDAGMIRAKNTHLCMGVKTGTDLVLLFHCKGDDKRLM